MCWKSFGVGGKAGSLLSWPSAERGCLVRGFLPVSSFLPALPSSPRPRDRCRGLWAQRERTRDAAAVAPRGERRARPSCPCGLGGLSRPSCAQYPGAPASSPAATGTRVPLAWPELGARPAQGAATCSGRGAELGNIRRGPTRADPRPPLCLLLPRPWCPQPVDALNLREGCSPGTERGAGTF